MIVGRRLPSILKRLFTGNIYRFSSSETAATQTAEEFEHEFQAIVTQTQLDKDEKYKEMAARFEREWTKLTEEARTQELRTVESDLTQNEKKKVEYLVTQVEKMNILEVRYFGNAVRDAIKKTSSLDFFSLNMNSPLFQQLSSNPWAINNPNIMTQQNAMANMMPLGAKNFAEILVGAMANNPAFMKGVNMVAPGGAAAEANAESAAAAKKVEEAPKEEKKPERLTFDIELTAIDPAQKIKVIKEVRQLTNLGLKEAKDFVEKLPGTLKKEVKKEEAEAIQKKLAEVGCTVTIV